MKILCLHGYGTSPDILRYQLSGVLKMADPTWEFHFLAGDIPCEPALGANNFPPPYMCYNNVFDPEHEALAHDLIEDEFIQHGPFEGVVAFSQGAATITSYLVERVASNPTESLPLRFLVLCSPTLPLASDRALCERFIENLNDADKLRLQSGDMSQIADISGPVQPAVQLMADVLEATREATHQPLGYYFDRPIDKVPWALNPDFCDARLSIPVFHVRGKSEPVAFAQCTRWISSFFDLKKQRFFEHTAGHDIPRSTSEIRRMISGIEWAVAQSGLPT
ncbi:serine hydrolase FSH [Penicillium malachiteum]|uniref:Serine hydrolase FSH n=1 Tax=Penicillium malachiteum TaxID=1324776 RepID=A0AAD6HK80_9EURO|nr:serine hydrolase FSH [Penicillium malachiteum]